MGEPRVVRGTVVSWVSRSQANISYSGGTLEPEFSDIRVPQILPLNQAVTILPHHSQGVGPLKGWMEKWTRDRKITDEVRQKIGRKESDQLIWDIQFARDVDLLVANAISEILGETEAA